MTEGQPRPVFYQPVPARGGHPGIHPDWNPVFQHDPRGYPPDWQSGWQSGYTDAWRGRARTDDAPAGVLETAHYWDGWNHGYQVGGWQRHAVRYGVLDNPSPFWVDPEETEDTGPWLVDLGTVEVDAATAHGAARQARRMVADGGFPSVVRVRAADTHEPVPITVDLDARPDRKGHQPR